MSIFSRIRSVVGAVRAAASNFVTEVRTAVRESARAETRSAAVEMPANDLRDAAAAIFKEATSATAEIMETEGKRSDPYADDPRGFWSPTDAASYATRDAPSARDDTPPNREELAGFIHAWMRVDGRYTEKTIERRTESIINDLLAHEDWEDLWDDGDYWEAYFDGEGESGRST